MTNNTLRRQSIKFYLFLHTQIVVSGSCCWSESESRLALECCWGFTENSATEQSGMASIADVVANPTLGSFVFSLCVIFTACVPF